MNYNFLNKSIHILLIIVFISHLTFFHNLLDDYVICSGNDGHIAIENVNECDDCSEFQFNGETKSVTVSSQDCEDVALNQNCFEDAEFISKNKIVITVNIVKLASIFDYTDCKKEFNNTFTNHYFENPILASYTSVSLQI